MIDAKDLRIGNLVTVGQEALFYREGKEVVLEVEDVSTSVIRFKNKPVAGEFPQDLEGIPLSEEWLKRAGFDYNPSLSAWCFEINPITQDYYITITETPRGFFYRNAGHGLKYVHQLQNLVHALLLQEITFTHAQREEA